MGGKIWRELAVAGGSRLGEAVDRTREAVRVEGGAGREGAPAREEGTSAWAGGNVSHVFQITGLRLRFEQHFGRWSNADAWSQ